MPTTIDIRYQTLQLPPPYSYAYTLQFRPEGKGVGVRLVWEYTDRDELTAEEVAEEGFTTDDDFHWQGTLPTVWNEALRDLQRRSRWVSEADPGDSALRVTVTDASSPVSTGSPGNRLEWEYFLQEAVQAVYEAARRERPLQLAYLRLDARDGREEIRWKASFEHRRFTVVRTAQGQSSSRELPWPQLRPLLEGWYVPDYLSERAESGAPRQPGEYIDPGEGIWYRWGKAVVNPGQSDALGRLRRIIEQFKGAPGGGAPD